MRNTGTNAVYRVWYIFFMFIRIASYSITKTCVVFRLKGVKNTHYEMSISPFLFLFGTIISKGTQNHAVGVYISLWFEYNIITISTQHQRFDFTVIHYVLYNYTSSYQVIWRVFTDGLHVCAAPLLAVEEQSIFKNQIISFLLQLFPALRHRKLTTGITRPRHFNYP
jgi:hypothetical protein